VRLTQSFHGFKEILLFDNWPMLLLGRLLDRQTGFVAYRKNGLDILVDHRGGDACGTRLCIATDMYRRYLPSLSLPAAPRVIDLGANGGGFPLMLAIQGIKPSRLVCVEMNPLTFGRLQLNLATNFGLDAVAINAAVCGQPMGDILIKPTRGGTGDSIRTLGATETEAHVAIPTATFLGIYERYFAPDVIDLCKVDIEGQEFEMFAALPDELVCKIRYLIMEFHYLNDDAIAAAEKLRARFQSLGFREITKGRKPEPGCFAEVRAFAGPETLADSVSPRTAAVAV
jgi:FkbM family methyltransferase